MAVLVTGGAGYIGSHMVLALQDRGEQTIVLDNLSTGVRESVHPAATLVVGDAGDPQLVQQIVDQYGIESIVHFAAKLVVPESVSDPLGYYHNNTVNTRALIEVAVKNGIRNFIFSSTAAVYGMPDTNPVSEDAPLRPMSPYGTSKMMSEMMLKDTALAHDLSYIILRYFNVAGADPQGRSGQRTPNATHLIKVACETALGARASINVFGTDYPTPDGTCIRDYIQVSDLISAHVLALDHLRKGGTSHILNCGYGQGYSVLDVLEAVKRANGKEFATILGPRRPGDPAAIVAKADRIREILGWKPHYANLDTIVTQALEWEKKMQAGQHTA